MLTRSFSRLPEIIRTGRAIPLISSEALSELEDVLARPKFRKQITAERTARFMAFLQLSGTMVEPAVEIKACRDPKNDHQLTMVVAGSHQISLRSAPLASTGPDLPNSRRAPSL